MNISLEQIYLPSEDVVAREIGGEIIIIPLVSGIGDLDDELFTLNKTAQAIWNLLDGSRTLGQIVETLSEEYEGSEIAQDIKGLMNELLKRRMVVEAG